MMLEDSDNIYRITCYFNRYLFEVASLECVVGYFDHIVVPGYFTKTWFLLPGSWEFL